MGKFFKRIWGTKTGKAAIGTIAATSVGMATGEVEAQVGLTPIVMSVLSIFLRDTEAKKQQDNDG